MKVALVHDYLIRMGGAEKVLLGIRKIFPQAPIYTLFYNQAKMARYFKDANIRPSLLQKTPILKNHHRLALPFLPAAVESFDLREFDLIISSCSSYVKGLVLRPKTIHICYCHSPTRFLWDWTHQYQSRLSFIRKLIFHYQRIWDRAAANRVDYFIANSKTTACRIQKYYGRQSKVIYPPVDLGKWAEIKKNFKGKNKKEYFLIVSQLTPYKRVDIAIDAFNKLELPLIIIGQGRDSQRLQKIARKNIRFLGWQSQKAVSRYYQNCKAFIFPGEDDFGITAVEAMGYGKPVLAYGRGGVTESVIESMTGEFFEDPVSESLADGVRRLLANYSSYSPLVIRKRAEKFSEQRFLTEMLIFIKQKTSSL